MGDDKAGPPAHELIHGLLDENLRAGVHVAGSLVQDEQLPVRQKGAGDGEQLLLSAGDGDVVLPDDRVIALGQGADEVVAVGLVAGPDDLLPGGLRFAVGHVFRHGALEEPGVLEHHGEQGAAAVPGDGGQVRTVHQNAPPVHVVKAHEQVDNGGLPRPGGAHNGHLLPRLHPDVQVLDEGSALVVGEAHVLEDHLPPDGGDVHLPLHGVLLLPVQQGEDPAGGGRGVLDVAHAVGDLLQGGGDLPGEEDDGHDGAHAHPPVYHQPPAQQVDEDVGRGVGEGDHRLDHAGQEIGPGLRPALEVADLLVPGPVVVLQVVGLGGGVVGVALLHHRVQAAALLVHLPEVGAALLRDVGGELDRQGHDDDHHQRQPPVLQQHHSGDSDDLKEAAHHGVNDLVDGVAHAGDIVGHPLEHLPHRGVVHKLHRQAADLVGNLDAQVAGEVHAHHPVEQLHLQVAEQALESVHPQEQHQSRPQAPPQGLIRRAAGQAQGPVVIEHLDNSTQQLGPRQGAGDHYQGEDASQCQPPADGFGGLDNAQDDPPVLRADGFCLLFLAHTCSPPVWEA